MRQLANTMDLGAAFDASPNAYVLLNTDLVIAGANTAYLELVNAKREQIIGRPMFEAFDSGPSDEAPENVRQVRDSILHAIKTGQRDHLAIVRFSIPFEDPTGAVIYEDRFWSATHTPIRDETGKVALVLQHTTDITEIESLRHQVGAVTGETSTALDAALGGGVLARAQQVQQSNRKLEIERRKLNDLFMQAPGFVAVLGGPDHVFELANSAYGQLIGHREVLGKSVREAMPEVVDQGFIDLLDHVYATGETYEGRESLLQLQRRKGGDLEDVYLNFIYQPIRGEEGRIVGVFVQGYEVTETVKADQRQRLMIDELNHRVKNTLATVQSIAMQTARTHEDPASFAETFQSRLMALSHTHNLLTRSHWEGADLRDVLQHETLAHGVHRVILNGPAVALSPAMAVSLGMIFHELATNAAKYGALSTGDGRVFVDWSVQDLTDRKLVIFWREQGGPAVSEPSRRGFGSRLIERNVRHDLAGEAKLVYASDGFNAEISLPLDRGDGHE
ncbi:HWE histidine kinase domain-containing protein [Brevundimonas sp.]|uniref:sensor histidine kinase n=1 Tax=Brevundimonas sp. TaxID=1871086 RepID=UPI0025BA1753|nr:HWE histidine kinase domain-containing protein [Brevundimonas sp.]